ncbi:MAPEG family protein [Microcystis aeruginosa]|uniref:MAPEG family protein n=1 Tax=Microcystis aeruginosa TaxID=1126 RepID=UPI00232B685B|nr:MAPEG family protein [Microcystis aeruginosa]MDB9415862.1 MAPEG family protein [Microcystis aeruginosa CS-556/03]
MNLSVSAILLYSIVAAAISVYLPFLLVAYARAKVGYNTSAPRAMFDQLPDYAKRATWAHQNGFETFMLYSAAALMAYVTRVSSSLAAVCAIAFVILRLLFSLFYITNVPIARSLMFGLGSLCTYTLFGLSLIKIQ